MQYRKKTKVSSERKQKKTKKNNKKISCSSGNKASLGWFSNK